jgi:uncharacterized protein
MAPSSQEPSPREQLVDALRGFALFGVLAANIQSYVMGVNGAGLGLLDAASSRADHLTVALLGLLVQYKFYPIFCFCFGYGFAVQTRRWRTQGVNAQHRFARRTDFMLGLGFLHGVFVWFGDILTSYGLAGKVLANHIGKGPKKLLPVLRVWFLLALIVAVPVTAVLVWMITGDADSSRADIDKAIALYSSANYASTLLPRFQDYLTVTIGFVMTGAEAILLMLLGAWCAHTGVLRTPQRHAPFWQRVLTWSLLMGIPANIAFAFGGYAGAAGWRTSGFDWTLFCHGFAVSLSGAYVAALALCAHHPFIRRCVALFAPMGRFALTHYLSQSLVMLFLLGGIGLGLGARLRQAELLLITMSVFALQCAVSHYWSRHHVSGPLESLWRRYTDHPQTQGKTR